MICKSNSVTATDCSQILFGRLHWMVLVSCRFCFVPCTCNMATTSRGIQIQFFQFFQKSVYRKQKYLNAGLFDLMFIYKCFVICYGPVFNEIGIHNLWQIDVVSGEAINFCLHVMNINNHGSIQIAENAFSLVFWIPWIKCIIRTHNDEIVFVHPYVLSYKLLYDFRLNLILRVYI
jgi:hypothetical protein